MARKSHAKRTKCIRSVLSVSACFFGARGIGRDQKKSSHIEALYFTCEKTKTNQKTQLFKPMKQDLTTEFLKEFSYQKPLTFEGELIPTELH